VLARDRAHPAPARIQSIEKSRQTQALTILAAEGAKTFGKKELADLTRTFEGSINDITSTLINNGYSRGFEQEADASAVRTLSRVGYNPNALVAMLREMGRQLKPGGLDFAKTHPSPGSRIADIESIVGRAALTEPPARHERFRSAMGNI
jgi:predicted Zn-dependent protease